MEETKITRRKLITNMGALAVGSMIVPRHVLGGAGYRAPSDKLNIAVIGAGARGAQDAVELVIGGENIVALADVDQAFVDEAVARRTKDRSGQPSPNYIKLQEAYNKAKRYTDYRQMLEQQKDIDAVLIATPDHFHAVAAKHSMELGKHVYVEKPLTYTVHEARVLRDVARKTKVVTQMGNQGHSSSDARLINEWIQAGVLGPVREVHVWTNRPVWPQGIPRPLTPAEAAGEPSWSQRALNKTIATALGGNYAAPKGLDWDIFLGPAPYVPYHPIYHPFNWRGWVDWGVGALGDMAAHLVDHPYWALEFSYPTSIEATSTPFGLDSEGKPASYPQATKVVYQFPARGAQPAVTLTWYDGGLMPARPAALPENVELNRGGGVFFIGDKGVLMHETYGSNPRLFPEALMEKAKSVPKSLPRVETSHQMNWALAAKGQGKPSCSFEYAAPLTETMLLGLVALRTGQGKQILFDGATGRVTNSTEANQYLHREYRKGWTL